MLRGIRSGSAGPLRPSHLLPVLGADAGAVRRAVLRGVPGGAGPGEAGTGSLVPGGAGPLPPPPPSATTITTTTPGPQPRPGLGSGRLPWGSRAAGWEGKAAGWAGAGAGPRSNS